MNFGEVNFPAAFGLGRAVEYLEEIGGVSPVKKRIDMLLDRMIQKMQQIPGVEIYGSPHAADRGGMIGFQNVGIMAHSFYSPGVLRLFGIEGVVRYCIHCWNTEEEVDYAVSLLEPERLSGLR